MPPSALIHRSWTRRHCGGLGQDADLRYWVVYDLQAALEDVAADTPLLVVLDVDDVVGWLRRFRPTPLVGEF